MAGFHTVKKKPYPSLIPVTSLLTVCHPYLWLPKLQIHSGTSFPRPWSSYGSKGFSILCFNARSLLPKLDELCITCLSHSYDIVMVDETWLSLDYELYIPGNCLQRCDRNRNGSWVLMYVSSNLTFRTRQHKEELELLLVDCVVSRNKCKPGL